MSKDIFSKHYKKEEMYWGLKPAKLVKAILKYKSSGTVLDIGCGEGRNAVFLAKKGFDVTGIDISKKGIEKMNLLAKKMNIKVKGIVEDIQKFKFDKKYDVILSIATFPFLKKKEIKKVISKIKENTKENGLNAILSFTTKDYFFGNKQMYFFKENELKEYYRDWNILIYKEFMTKPEKHGDGVYHRHGVSVILAQKKIYEKVHITNKKVVLWNAINFLNF